MRRLHAKHRSPAGSSLRPAGFRRSALGLGIPMVLAGTLLLAAGGTDAAAQSGSLAAPAGASTAPPSAPRTPDLFGRTVRVFDFEESNAAPIDFPVQWQNLAEAYGLPPFGRMEPSREYATSGNWSFKFEPDGVTLAAGVPSGVIGVFPMTDYRVRCRVRTEGITVGRARLAALLCDERGRPIDGHRYETRAIRSEGTWTDLEILVPGDAPDAVSLVVELSLEQPGSRDDEDPIAGAGPGAGADSDADGDRPGDLDPLVPVHTDVHGAAWFDDIIVEQVSRIEMATTGPRQVVIAPNMPSLGVVVRDLGTATMNAVLTVRDVHGEVVVERDVRGIRALGEMQVDVPLSRYGWYDAELVVYDGDVIAGRRSIAFAYVPPMHRAGVADAGTQLGVIVPSAREIEPRRTAGLALTLGVRSAVVPAWPPMRNDPEVADAVRRSIDQLVDGDVDVTLALSKADATTALQTGLDPNQVLELLAQPIESWSADIEPLVIAYGLRVSRWLIGGPGDDPALRRTDTPELIRRATEHARRVMPAPILVVPTSAVSQYEAAAADERLVRIPVAARPEDIPQWVGDPGDAVLLETDPDLPAIDQVADLALRIAWAWRAGVRGIHVDAPWRRRATPRSTLDLHPTFPMIRRMADAVHGRRFAGVLRLGDGINAWLMEGGSTGDHALLTWRDGRNGDPAAEVRIGLGRGAIERVDLFGNATPVRRAADGRHQLEITALPQIVRGVDLELLLFRTGLSLEPGTIPAVYKAHDLELVISNPWSYAITGMVVLDETDGRRLRPHRHPFTLQPGETIKRPLTAVFDRSVIAGPQPVDALVQVEAVHRETLQLALPIEVGWQDIDVSATWSTEPNLDSGGTDLVVRTFVTNRGANAVHLDAFLRGPGLGRERRALERLERGATAVRTFRIPEGAALLSGTTLRYGVTERGGPAQLNRILVIPNLDGVAGPGPARAVQVPTGR